MSGRIHCTIEGAVARVVISHPARFNAMTRAMWRELREAFEALRAHEKLVAVVVEGEGAHFCAGGDISEYSHFRFDEVALRRFHEEEVWGGLQAVLDCDAPVIAVIRGNCMGAGVEIASACDIRIASGDARFGAPIARLGFPMAPREAQLVARVMGEATVREMLLAAAVLDARELKARGGLHRIVPPAMLACELERLLRTLAGLSPLAARRHKQLLRRLAQGAPLDELLTTAYDYAADPEHREGILAFLDKRAPVFR
jgi:enoyl-CoA hydratase/carnithine racemase